jgi:hypothetical protein
VFFQTRRAHGKKQRSGRSPLSPDATIPEDTGPQMRPSLPAIRDSLRLSYLAIRLVLRFIDAPQNHVKNVHESESV